MGHCSVGQSVPARDTARKISAKRPRVARAAKEALNLIDVYDLQKHYRLEQGYTYELNLHGEGERPAMSLWRERALSPGRRSLMPRQAAHDGERRCFSVAADWMTIYVVDELVVPPGNPVPVRALLARGYLPGAPERGLELDGSNRAAAPRVSDR